MYSDVSAWLGQGLNGKEWGRTPPNPHKKYYKIFSSQGFKRQILDTMDSVYKPSSTERVLLLEKELAERLSELKAGLEEQGLLPGTANRVFRYSQSEGGAVELFSRSRPPPFCPGLLLQVKFRYLTPNNSSQRLVPVAGTNGAQPCLAAEIR